MNGTPKCNILAKPLPVTWDIGAQEQTGGKLASKWRSIIRHTLVDATSRAVAT
jgi:hypothetical protein